MPATNPHIVNELKPLYANLKRLHIGKYLYTKEFEYYTIENQEDDLWKDCLKAATKDKTVFVLGHHDIEEDEAAFLIFMSVIYKDNTAGFFDMLSDVLIDFAKWHPIKLNFKSIFDNLDDLGFSDRDISKLEDEAKTIMKNKPKNIEQIKESNITITKAKTDKVFVVHGWADVDRLEVCNLLKDEFNLTPVVMQEQPNEALDTIIAKFERLAKECSAAVILFTPDDQVGDKSRARQNVIFELGYFLGMFQSPGERRIIILKKGDIEIPSDIQGVLYLSYNKSVTEIYLQLKKQLKHWGYQF